MKLTCDLCGGTLQVNPGGQGATCSTCGLGYTMERLREKLGIRNEEQNNPKPVPPKPVPPKPDEEIIYEVTDWEVANPSNSGFDFVPEQFVMENNGSGNGDLCGRVLRGGIGLGDQIYIDGDYAHPYRLYLINDDGSKVCAKEGESADLYLVTCPRKVLRNARMVTGDPNPVANAYNYPGTVRQYFSKLLGSEFPQYEILMDVAHDALKIPVSYLLFRDGKPAVAVFLIDSNDSSARWQVEKAAQVFGGEGVACTHFFENYRNDAPYVIDRVRGAMG